MKSPKFLISGGGTGGHIFPAIAIADEIKRRIPHAEFLFIGAQDKMEMEKVPQAGYKIEGLWISGLSRSSLLANLSFPIKLISSLIKAKKIIRTFKPDAAIGTGGFASGPALFTAINAGVPIFLQEQNSFAGITNKKLAAKSKRIFVAYEGMDKFFPINRICLTGNPVRKSLFTNKISQKEAKEKLGLNTEKLTILSIGGSLGSRTINNFWKQKANEVINLGAQILWQVGKSDFSSLDIENNFNNKEIHCTEFIKEMEIAYAAADIIVSRAGAIAISELCLAGKPTILIPFPYAADDHQTKNAEQLVKKEAAIKVNDRHVSQELLPKIENLINNQELRESLSLNIRKLAKPNATEEIVDQILTEINLDF